MKRLRRDLAALAFLAGASPAFAGAVPRGPAPEGSVVARKSGEEVRFVEVADWRGVEVDQDLVAGDTLRTNAQGSLAIRFVDNTLVRMGRETVLRVRRIDPAASSELDLEGGTIWGRAERGGSGLTVDTPAAAAAIRGTDWSLRAEGDRTTLTVLEGTVELVNPQGSVTVRQGEGAVALLGQAPRKYILVDLDEREQILIYREIRGTFSSLPVDGGAGRAERERILGMAEAARGREDWLSLAETALAQDGRAAAEAALSRLSRPLPAALEARATLVEAMIAGQAMRYGEAVRLFRKARAGLSGERRSMAGYGEWIAASLEDPDRPHASPPLNRTPATAAEAAAQATVIAHMRGQAEAIALLERAEQRFPGDASLPAMRASLAFELDRRDTVREALGRARALDPDDPAYLLANARFRAAVSSDLDGALSDLARAAEISPGDDAVWSEIGIVQSDRNAPVEADAAHRRAVALNPENAALRANYARFLTESDQMAAARREIEAAEALDPQSYAVLAAKGRYLLRMGRTAEGEAVLQEAAAVNPTDGDALIGLAIANYQSGAGGEAAQALDNADRFDADNPTIALMRAGIALDQYRADDAVTAAREALRRRQARGGYYTGYDANRQASAVLGDTLDNLGLSEWSQYYKDRAFDPFLAGSYVDEQRGGRVSPFVAAPPSGLDRFPSAGIYLPTNLQNLLLDPLAVAFEERFNALERRSFHETSLAGGFSDEGGGFGWNGEVGLRGTSYAAVPLSYSLQAELSRPEGARENDAADFEGGVIELGLKPTVSDNVYLFGDLNRSVSGYPGQTWFPTPFDGVSGRSDRLGAGWSHTIGDRNIVQAFGIVERIRATTDYEQVDDFGPYHVTEEDDTRRRSFGLSHLVGLGPLALRYGAETLSYDTKVDGLVTDLPTGAMFPYVQVLEGKASRLYADGILDVSSDLKLQAGAYYSWFDSLTGTFETVDPRIGVAWAPAENHWLRASFRRDTQFPVVQTLSPVSTVGLVPLQVPLLFEGRTKTFAARWDAEWSERLFTSVEYQKTAFDGAVIDIPDLRGWFSTGTGEIGRLSVAANYWLGNGLGLFGSFAWNESRDTTPWTGGGNPVPLVPDYVGQVGVTWVHPARITFSAAQTFVGPRTGAQFLDPAGLPVAFALDRYATTDFALGWKSESGHLEIALQLLNAFDKHVEMALDIPAPRRTFLATMKARF